MRAVVQRVSSASVTVGGESVASIGAGLLVLAAVGDGDGDADADYLADKIANLRVFPDDAGRFDRSALDLGAPLLIVSQFTLYGDVRKGRRPSFTDAAPPGEAQERFAGLVERFRATGLPVQTGRFQEMMDVALVNDGPVTLILDSADRRRPRR